MIGRPFLLVKDLIISRDLRSTALISHNTSIFFCDVAEDEDVWTVRGKVIEISVCVISVSLSSHITNQILRYVRKQTKTVMGNTPEFQKVKRKRELARLFFTLTIFSSQRTSDY